MHGDRNPRMVEEIGVAICPETVKLMIEFPMPDGQLLVRQFPEQAVRLGPRGALRRQAQQGTPFRVPGLQLRRPERPAGVRHPVAPFEIDRIEMGAAPAPDRGGPTEKAETRRFEVVIGLADTFAGVEVGGLGLIVEAAALQQHDAEAAIDQRRATAIPAAPAPITATSASSRSGAPSSRSISIRYGVAPGPPRFEGPGETEAGPA